MKRREFALGLASFIGLAAVPAFAKTDVEITTATVMAEITATTETEDQKLQL